MGQCFLGGFQSGHRFVSFLRIDCDDGLASYSKSTGSSGHIRHVLVVVSLRLVASGRCVVVVVSAGFGSGPCLDFLVCGGFAGLYGACYNGSGLVSYHRLSGTACTIRHSQFGLVGHGV